MTGKLKVIVSTEDDAESHMFILSSEDQIQTVIDEWRKASSDGRQFQLFKDQEILTFDRSLSDLEIMPPNILCLIVIYAVPVLFQVYPSVGPVLELNVPQTATPQQLNQLILSKFNIHHERLFRLLKSRRILNDDEPIIDTGGMEEDLIMIDLSHEVTIIDLWNQETLYTIQLFSSDSLDGLISEDEQLYAGSRRVNLSQEICEIPGFDKHPLDIRLYLGRMESVHALIEGRIQTLNILPTKKVRHLPRSYADLLNATRGARNKTQCNGLISPDTILLPPEITLIAKINDYQRVKLQVPKDGIVSEVRQMICQTLEQQSVQLFLHGRRLNEDYLSLRNVGLYDGTEIDVILAPMEISLSVRDSTYKWVPNETTLRFSHILSVCKVIHEGTLLGPREIESGYFECIGCKRRLTADGENFQIIPVPCCKVQSLKLSFVQNAKDVGIQKNGSIMANVATQVEDLLEEKNSTHVDDQNQAVVTSDESSQTDQWISDENQAVVTSDESSQTDQWISDTYDEFPIRISLPFIGSFWHSIRRNHTIRDILNDLRRSRKFFYVTDVLGHDTILSGGFGWLEKTAYQCNLHIDQELYINVPAVQQITINIRGPGDRDGYWYNIDNELGHCTINNLILLSQCRHDFDYEESTLLIQFGNIYTSVDGSLRRSYDSSSDTIRDEETGSVVDHGKCVLQVMEFLSEQSIISSAFTRCSVVTISLDNVVWRITSVIGSNYNVEVVDRSALHDIQYIAQVEFLRMRDTRSSSTKLFIELAYGYANCGNGSFAGATEVEVIDSEKKIPKEYQQWNRCILLFKDGDMIPRVRLPGSGTVAVFVRANLHVKVINNKIVRFSSVSDINDKLWTFMRSGKNTGRFSKFEANFTRSMKRN